MNTIKVFNKEITLENNINISCAIVDNIVINVSTKNGEKNISANVHVLFYKDRASFEAGVPMVEEKSYLLSNLESAPEYLGASQFFIGALLANPDFTGALIEDAVIPQPAPMPVNKVN